MSNASTAKTKALDAFGEMAQMDIDPTVKAGRYPFQAMAERRIFSDILPKLALESHHRMLDIGCGSGVLLVPLSYCVREIVGLDHQSVVDALADAHRLPNASFVGGGFPDAPLTGRFDRIVAYSVLPCMPDYDAVIAFCRAAAALLPEGGRLLLGDIPNRDRQLRIKNSAKGAEFEADWIRQRADYEWSEDQLAATSELSKAAQIGPMTDDQVLGILKALRDDGFDCWIVPQAPDLPFGRTREDIIVTRP